MNDEGKKRTLAVITAILAGPELRKLGHTNSTPELVFIIGKAISLGERIMNSVEKRFPASAGIDPRH